MLSQISSGSVRSSGPTLVVWTAIQFTSLPQEPLLTQVTVTYQSAQASSSSIASLAFPGAGSTVAS